MLIKVLRNDLEFSQVEVEPMLVQSRKVLHLEVWNIQGKGLILIRFLSYRSRGVS